MHHSRIVEFGLAPPVRQDHSESKPAPGAELEMTMIHSYHGATAPRA